MTKLSVSEKLKLMPVVPYTVAMTGGIIIGYLFPVPHVYALVEMAVCVIIAFFLSDSRTWRQIPLLIGTLFLGAVLVGLHDIREKSLFPETPVYVDVVVEDTPKYTDWGLVVPCYIVSHSDKADNGNIIERAFGRKIRCTFPEPQFIPSVGNTLTIRGRLRKIVDDKRKVHSRNGNFNYQRWLIANSFAGQITVYKGNAVVSDMDGLSELPAMSRISVKARIIRHRILKAFKSEFIDGRYYAVIAAMGFGERSGLTKEARDVFSQTGVAHLLALSGMHLGILYVLLMFVFGNFEKLLAFRFDIRLLTRTVVIASIWGYVMLVGMPQSVIRAAIMLTLYTAVSFASRSKMSMNALAVTAMIMLVTNPMAVWDVGFEMSFLAMTGIFVFYDYLYNIIGVKYLFRHPILRKGWSLLCVSTAAQIGTLPLSVYYFGRIPVLFLFTNIVAIPLVTLLLYCVFLSLVLWSVPVIRTALLFVAEFLASVLMSFLEKVAGWSFASINNISINWIQMMLIYLLIVVVAIFVVRFSQIIGKIFARRRHGI